MCVQMCVCARKSGLTISSSVVFGVFFNCLEQTAPQISTFERQNSPSKDAGYRGRSQLIMKWFSNWDTDVKCEVQSGPSVNAGSVRGFNPNSLAWLQQVQHL